MAVIISHLPICLMHSFFRTGNVCPLCSPRTEAFILSKSEISQFKNNVNPQVCETCMFVYHWYRLIKIYLRFKNTQYRFNTKPCKACKSVKRDHRHKSCLHNCFKHQCYEYCVLKSPVLGPSFLKKNKTEGRKTTVW